MLLKSEVTSQNWTQFIYDKCAKTLSFVCAYFVVKFKKMAAKQNSIIREGKITDIYLYIYFCNITLSIKFFIDFMLSTTIV